MKYYRFEKIKKGNHPIIRVTYKKFSGGLVYRDVCKTTNDLWRFMDNGGLVKNYEPIDVFHENDEDIYWVNGFSNPT